MMDSRTSLAAHFLFLCSVVAGARAENWPNWRGPAGTGVSSEKNLPIEWTDKENVRWRVDLPGPGNSSPIVWDDRVFVSQAVDEDARRTLMCFDRASGELLWQSGVSFTDEERTHQTNPYCAGTPATDGERIYVCFGSPGVFAYDFAGNELWRRDLGRLNHVFGTAVTCTLYGELCIVNFGPGEGARLVALNKQSGDIVWEIEPPAVDPSELAPPGGFGGRGGRGGFGPGNMLGGPMFSQADKDEDQKLTKEEFAALAEEWFDKLDSEKAGKLSQDTFVNGLAEILPPPPGFGPPGGGRRGGDAPRGNEGRGGQGRGGRGGPFGPARFVGPGLFAALDADKDASLTRDELKGTFEKWANEWDAEKSGSLTEDQLRDGLTAALPQPDFGGGFGGQPGGGPRRGGGGLGGNGRGGGPGGFANFGGSWSTPLVIHSDGRDELIVGFTGRLVAYDPNTGQQLWISKGLGGTVYTTPLWGDGMLVAMTSGAGGGSAMAVKPGGSGDVTESRRLWRLERFDSQIGSGVIHEGHFYSISQQGVAACYELNTGERVWQRRLAGSGGQGDAWSSMLLADGRIYVPNQSGDVFVLRASPEYELLATNSAGESTNASLAASDGDLILRTDRGLWCFSNRQ
jgi:outer membrane protein assembly factor BamB